MHRQRWTKAFPLTVTRFCCCKLGYHFPHYMKACAMPTNKSKSPLDNVTQSDNQSDQDDEKPWRGILLFSVVASILLAVFYTFPKPSNRDRFHAPLASKFSADFKRISEERSLTGYTFSHSTRGIDRRSDLSLQEFYDVYDGKWPVLLTDVVTAWPASNWTSSDLIAKYGTQRVSIKAVDKDLDAAISQLLQMQLLSVEPQLRDIQPPTKQGSLSTAVSLTLPLERFRQHAHQPGRPTHWFYVEDELFIPMRPELKSQLWDSPFLKEDFFQVFPSSVRPWDAMLLWGTAFSRSSLHIDPYNWTGTNAVLSGRKRWKMFPPGQDHLLSVKDNQMSGFPLNCFKYNSPLDTFDPEDWQKLSGKIDSFEFDQLPGELLIIPPGWFHQAFNVEETLAVSGQLMNRNNYRIVLEEIMKTEVISRSSLPKNIDQMTVENQIKAVLSLLPQEVLDRGKSVTESVLRQMQHSSTEFENYL
ncbi:hypothetical protein CAPTEDRAFT_225272 [Capitella teleta]|uniref:JmjC domain-containing protein n=1 Tax=Capitella teleta TaxID=283909 RepID=R7U5N0_CAPTE|nr:hypothetical protein CAPTEDRAFT_225272 [Capitella teleta]|eukprot:ELT98450.1 hypothetical protein CAPTEDRAFT_225272 [Capitella teleta]